MQDITLQHFSNTDNLIYSVTLPSGAIATNPRDFEEQKLTGETTPGKKKFQRLIKRASQPLPKAKDKRR